MKQKNILFTDMDGTILFSDNGKTYFKESDLDAIKEFQQRGNLIVINSGRALPWIVAPLEGYLLPDYMIASRGSIIADSHQQIFIQRFYNRSFLIMIFFKRFDVFCEMYRFVFENTV